MNLCVIPARGGSKRIPGKNIRNFAGRPILGWSIEAALRSEVFDRVIVSTDDQAVARVAEAEGAAVPFFRPSELADDHTTTAPVVAHAVDTLESQGEKYRFVACVYPTAPFLTATTIRSGLERLRASSASYAVTVTTFPFPVQRALRLGSDGRLGMLYPEHRESRSQDLEETWHDAGQLYWGRAEAFQVGTPLFAEGSTVPIPVARERVQDIDTPEDWARAEVLFRVLESSLGEDA